MYKIVIIFSLSAFPILVRSVSDANYKYWDTEPEPYAYLEEAIMGGHISAPKHIVERIKAKTKAKEKGEVDNIASIHGRKDENDEIEQDNARNVDEYVDKVENPWTISRKFKSDIIDWFYEAANFNKACQKEMKDIPLHHPRRTMSSALTPSTHSGEIEDPG